jgi:hypothetical protein
MGASAPTNRLTDTRTRECAHQWWRGRLAGRPKPVAALVDTMPPQDPNDDDDIDDTEEDDEEADEDREPAVIREPDRDE